MNRFEDELKLALARHEPPRHFTERVLGKIQEQNGPSPTRVPSLQSHAFPLRGLLSRDLWFRRLAPLAAIALTLVGGFLYREHQQEVQGQAAKDKLLFAMRIASEKLNETRLQLQYIEHTGSVQ